MLNATRPFNWRAFGRASDGNSKEPCQALTLAELVCPMLEQGIGQLRGSEAAVQPWAATAG
jgi:hypothetical protein